MESEAVNDTAAVMIDNDDSGIDELDITNLERIPPQIDSDANNNKDLTKLSNGESSHVALRGSSRRRTARLKPQLPGL